MKITGKKFIFFLLLAVFLPFSASGITLTVDDSFCVEGEPYIPLSWTSVSGALKYEIYRGALKIEETTNNTFEDGPDIEPNIVEEEEYNYKVKAILDGGEEESNIEPASASICPPHLTVESVCNGSALLNPEMRLSWTSVPGANHYNVYRDDSFHKQVFDESYTDYLNSSGTYEYRVEADVTAYQPLQSNSVEKSINCDEVSDPSPSPDLEDLEDSDFHCDDGNSGVTISWRASDNITYYTLYRNNEGIIDLINSSYSDYGIESGYEYTYRVTAFGLTGEATTDSNNSKTITAQDCSQPSTPVLSLSEDCNGEEPYIDLSWTETSNTLKYEIYSGTSTDELILREIYDKEEDSTKFNEREWRDSSLSKSTSYYYKIKAVSYEGVTPSESDIESLTTSSCMPTDPDLALSGACDSGNPEVNLSWNSADPETTDHYEIFREDYSTTNPLHQIDDLSVTDWKDTNVLGDTSYNYKVESVGHGENPPRTSSGYESITTYNCSPPGNFTLSKSADYCKGPYPRTDLSWTDSSNSYSYDFFRNRLNADDSIAETKTLTDVSSSVTDWGNGRALSFDGSYVKITDDEHLQISDNITVSFWMKLHDWTGSYSQNLMYKYGGTSDAQFRFYLDGTHLTDKMRVYATREGSWSTVSPTSQSFSLNTWYHIVWTYSSNGGFLYVNGESQGKRSYAGELAVAEGNSIIIGGGGFNGLMNDVRIYGRALSENEAESLYKGESVSEAELRGLWRFDEGSGSIASDSSNYRKDGTLEGSPTWVSHGLQSQTKYSWQIEAKGPPGVSSTFSNIVDSTMPFCSPTKPGLDLTAYCEGGEVKVELDWSYTTDTVKYEIYRDDSLIKNINEGEDGFSSRTWIDSNTSETSHTYYIKAIGPTGLSSQSDSISIANLECTSLEKPENLTVNPSCGGDNNSYPQVSISWDEVNRASYYEIHRDPNGSFPVTTETNSYTDTSVTVGTDYDYYVIAYGVSGSSPVSDQVTATTSYCEVSTPDVILQTNCENSSPFVNVLWTDETDFNTEEYKIYRNTSGSNPDESNLIETITSGMSEFSSKTFKDDSSLSSLTEYYYWVKTVSPDTGKESELSSREQISTYGCGLTPSAPTLNLDNVQCLNNIPYPTFNWNEVNNAYSYNLYRQNPDGSQSVYYTRLPSLTDKGRYSLQFDGNNDYVEVDNSSELNPERITMEAWVYPTEFNYYATIIYKPSQYWLRFYSTTGRVRGYVYVDGGWRNCIVSSSYAVGLNSWSHVAATYDGNTLRVYVNGEEGCTTTYRGKINSYSNYLRIGVYSSSSYQFNGLIKGARIYERALSESEISDHSGGVYNNEAGLQGVWNFDEGTGTTAYDESGKGNHGELKNGPSWSTNSPEPIPLVENSTEEDPNAYSYKVKAFGTDTESGFSNEVLLDYSCLPAKPDLEIIQECPDEKSQLRLDWSDDPNTEYWTVYKKRGDDDFSIVANVASSTFADVNVESGIEYEYYLTASGDGVDQISDIVSEEAPFCYPEPSKPIISSVETDCYGYSARISVEWGSDPEENTVSYNIWRKEGSGDFVEVLEDLSASAVIYNDSDIVEGETYSYKIEAVGGGSENTVFSEESNSVEALECSTMSPFPITIEEDEVISTYETIATIISWGDINNEDYYRVMRTSSPFTEIATLTEGDHYDPGDVLYYTDYTAEDGRTYEYRVVAVNDNGETNSNTIRVNIPIAPPANFTLSGTREDDRYRLNWTEASSTSAGGDVSYEVLKDTSISFDSAITLPCPDAESLQQCYDEDTKFLERNYYKVVATNNGGSTDSNIVRIFPLSPTWKETAPYKD